MKDKILVIDDDKSVLHLFQIYLLEEGFCPFLADCTDKAMRYLNKNPDLIILDVNMPGTNGIDFCRKVRNFVQCPIIFLSGCVSQHDKIMGLKAGGDDYLLKPFDMEELVERIKAHIRRENRVQLKRELKFKDDLVIDFAQHKLFWKQNEIELLNKEYQIVELLIKNTGVVLDRETIYERVWGFNSEGDSSVVKEHIRRIRNKLQKYNLGNSIETVWGVGYRWRN